MKKIILLTALLTTFYWGTAQIQNYSVGEVVNDFTVTDIDGVEHNLYAYTAAGKYVFLDFFFTTCGPCQATVPYFNELYDKYGCNQGDIICLEMNNGQDNNDAVATYSATFGGPFHHSPAVSNEGGGNEVDNDFNPTAYPTYCLIGPDNTLVNADIWPISSVSDFENAFPAALNPEVLTCTVGTDDDYTERIDATVYPSPASDELHIMFPITNDKEVFLEVYNIKGEVVTSGKMISSDQELVISVREFSEGVYFARIEMDKEKSEAIQFTVIR